MIKRFALMQTDSVLTSIGSSWRLYAVLSLGSSLSLRCLEVKFDDLCFSVGGMWRRPASSSLSAQRSRYNIHVDETMYRSSVDLERTLASPKRLSLNRCWFITEVSCVLFFKIIYHSLGLVENKHTKWIDIQLSELRWLAVE